MSIEILEAASSFDLTIKEVVQTQLSLAVGTDDELLDQLIAAASSFITSYTNRQFAKERWLEIVPAYDTNWLQINLTPIETINSISIAGSVITDFTIDDAKAGLVFRQLGFEGSHSHYRMIAVQPIPNSSLPRVSVNYYGGYVLPSHTTGTINLPGVIQQACNDLVRLWYTELKNNLPANTKQVKIGDYTISFENDQSVDGTLGVPSSVLAKLRPWRRVV